MEERNESFVYTYSAKEQEELKNIRKKYEPVKESKMEQLRRLDTGVTNKATTAGLVIGTCGTLVLGAGMSMCMVWQGLWFIPGIALGLLGIAAAAAAYPFYCRVLKKEREKIAPEILRLSDELMK